MVHTPVPTEGVLAPITVDTDPHDGIEISEPAADVVGVVSTVTVADALFAAAHAPLVITAR